MVSLWKQINKSAKGGAGTTSYNYSFMRSYTSSKQTWQCCLHRSASVYASIINNAWATEATQRQLSSHYFIAASVCVHRVRDGTNSIELPKVCVSETISRQPTDCIDRSIYAYSWSCNHKTHMVCRPALAHMHAFRTLEGHARRYVAAPCIIISPVETLCTYASCSICHCASHAYCILFTIRANTVGSRERERERCIMHMHAGRIAWCIARPSAGNRSPYGDAAAHCPWFEGALLLRTRLPLHAWTC